MTVADGPLSPGESGDEEDELVLRYIGDDDDDDDDDLGPRRKGRTTIDRKQSRK